MNLPERFDLTYVDSDGSKKRPVMLHRVIYGSIERFIGILIEHYAGAFPLWLAPVQFTIIPVNNDIHLEYATKIKELLENNKYRVNLDVRNEKLSYKMRESQVKKVPITIILGDKEKENEDISYRLFGEKNTNTLKIAEFLELVKEKIKNKN